MTIDKSPDRGAEGATRRTVLTGGAAAMIDWEVAPDVAELIIPEAHAATPAMAKDEMAVTLLGTASPQPKPDRFGPAFISTGSSGRLGFRRIRAIAL